MVVRWTQHDHAFLVWLKSARYHHVEMNHLIELSPFSRRHRSFITVLVRGTKVTCLTGFKLIFCILYWEEFSAQQILFWETQKGRHCRSTTTVNMKYGLSQHITCVELALPRLKIIFWSCRDLWQTSFCGNVPHSSKEKWRHRRTITNCII